MEEPREESKTTEENIPKFRGLYRYVKISVKALDRIIVACIAVIVIVVALELRNPGYTITFDTKGGTDVAAQTQMYGELLTEPEPPTREGYRFTGWYKDYNCDEQWDIQNDTVEVDLTLYAGWEKLE
ncbi:MAG: InlB B-repeat-containing protein [Oscillospiraceae bacterium]|nr:InlB B-repeat-containing protein [Oscillospiraceae bacterium]